MNILIVSSRGLGYGGAQITTKQFAEELGRHGHQVFVASSGDFQELSNVITFKFIEKWPYFLQRIYLERFLTKLIKKYNIEIINPQDHTATLGAMAAAKRCSIPIVINIRDYWFACPKSSCYRDCDSKECNSCNAFRLFTCVKLYRYPFDLYKLFHLKRMSKLLNPVGLKIVASNALKNRLNINGIVNNINVLPVTRCFDVIDISNKEKDNIRKKYSLKKIVITFVGSFFVTKGVLKLFEFMPIVLRKYPDVSLLLIGDGPLENKIRQKIIQENLVDQIVLIGRLSYSESQKLYSISDIVLIPHQWSEPFGVIMLEAAFYGKPSLVSDKGGASDFKDYFGYNIPAEDISQWKEKTLLLIENKKLRLALGQKAKKNVKSFSMNGYTDQMEKLFRREISLFSNKDVMPKE